MSVLTNAVDTVTSVAATFARGGRGVQTEPASVKPAQLPILYEFEACPYCRLVREAITELDLEVLVRPCPKGGTRFRPEVVEKGGKAQFPFLDDPNTGRRLYESGDIIAYLFETYGQRPLPSGWRLRSLQVASSLAATALRPFAGAKARPSRAPDAPLELYGFESSPFVRLVRETLCSLELPYHLHPVGRTRASDFVPPVVRDRLKLDLKVEGDSRQAFVARSGRMMVPWLSDPNTGTALFESADIRHYLIDTYAR